MYKIMRKSRKTKITLNTFLNAFNLRRAWTYTAGIKLGVLKRKILRNIKKKQHDVVIG